MQAKLKQFIERRRESLIADWFEIVRQPSISSTGEGVVDCCNLLVRKMEELGIEVQVFESLRYPIIFGRYGRDPNKKTVLMYAHYDVQPPDPESEWNTPPFEPTVIDGVAYARGISDNKAGLMAQLKAFEFWVREIGEVPVNLKFVYEGCEENSSVGLPEFVAENAELLEADVVYSSDGCRHESGVPAICLGAKGLLSIELDMKTIGRDAHSSNAPVLKNAALEMARLLVQINDQGKIRVPGFYDSVVMPTELEKQILQQLPDVEAEMEQVFGVKPVVPEGSTYYEHFLYSPTFNVSGLNAGYTGKGRKTIVPAQASAKVDMRLVPNQDPQEIFELVSAYIEQMGYDNVSVRKLGAVHPSRTPLDTPYLEAFKAATVDTFDGYIIYPRRAATGPDYVWTQILHKPVIQVRYSDADSANHSPNEKLKIDTFLKGIELAARVASYISKM